MILGLAVPRWHITWFATKVEVAQVDESLIQLPSVKKGKVYTKKELAEKLLKTCKESGWLNATLDKVMELPDEFVS